MVNIEFFKNVTQQCMLIGPEGWIIIKLRKMNTRPSIYMYTSSSRNCIFSKSRFSDKPQEKYKHVTILHSKSLKKCHKNNKKKKKKKNKIKICQKIFLNRAFSIAKFPAREVTIFPKKKSKLIIFHLKCAKPKQNSI